MILKDKKFRLVREWTNTELQKFASLFTGDVINISGWKDLDKQGGNYKHYFKNCSSYLISNYRTVNKGFQDQNDEIFLNLEDDLDVDSHEKFDVVFNHTTLEHIFNFKKAFENLCLLSRDIVILIVPFLQQWHGEDFEDYWRFSPSAIRKLFKNQGFTLIYLSYNNHKRSSVYIFCIASKNPAKWKVKITQRQIRNKKIWLDPYPSYIGSRTIINNLFFRIKMKILSLFKKELYY